MDPKPIWTGSLYDQNTRTQRHLWAWERTLWRNNLADTLILNFEPPEPCENKFLLFNPPSLWYFVMAALPNYYAVQFLVTQSCQALCGPTDCSPPGSSVHGILQARILEWVAMPSSRGSFQPRDHTQDSCIAGGFFTVWATREALSNYYRSLIKLSKTTEQAT